jgi:hypothetical protein
VHVPKKLAALAPAVVMALALGACASLEPSTPSEGSEAAETAAAPASNIAELVEQMSASEASSAHVEITYSGKLAKTSGLDASTTTADIAYGGSVQESTMHMSMAVMGMDVDMILVDGIMYLGMGELSDDKYFSISLEEMAKDPSMSAMLDTLDSIDAAAYGEMVADAVTSFEHTGTEQVAGVDADVYTMTVDPTKIDGAALGFDEAMVDPMLDEVGEMTVVYTIGPDGLPLKTDNIMKVDGQKLITESTFSAWGEPVDVEAPPKADVVPYSEVAGQG